MPQVTSGVENGNVRQLALARMNDLDIPCREVRSREVGIRVCFRFVVFVWDGMTACSWSFDHCFVILRMVSVLGGIVVFALLESFLFPLCDIKFSKPFS